MKCVYTEGVAGGVSSKLDTFGNTIDEVSIYYNRSCHSSVCYAFYELNPSIEIVDRVIDGTIKQGLIWHFQGSGKSLLMVFAA